MRRPTWLETLLLVALAIALTAFLVRDGGISKTAYASGGGGGTNSVIAFAAQAYGNNVADQLYVIDTTRQRICLYKWDGTHFGLAAARAFDYDVELQDSTGDKAFETGVGVSRGYVKAQVEAFRRAKEIAPPK